MLVFQQSSTNATTMWQAGNIGSFICIFWIILFKNIMQLCICIQGN